jgi:hypothetical protein
VIGAHASTPTACSIYYATHDCVAFRANELQDAVPQTRPELWRSKHIRTFQSHSERREWNRRLFAQHQLGSIFLCDPFDTQRRQYWQSQLWPHLQLFAVAIAAEHSECCCGGAVSFGQSRNGGKYTFSTIARSCDVRGIHRTAAIALPTTGGSKLTSLTVIALRARCSSLILGAGVAIVLGVALTTAPTSALAEALVHGSLEAVIIEANNTSIEEILAALSNAFDLHYRSMANLEKPLTGNYAGSLQKVMKHILNGYNFYVKTGNGVIEVTVLETSNATPATEASSSFQVAERPAGAAPVQPPPAIAEVEPSVPPVPPAAPSAHEPHRDHHVVDGEKESQPSPPHRTKTAGSVWRRSNSHVRRKFIAQSSMTRPSSLVPASSYYWLPWGPYCCTARIRFALDRSRIGVPRRHARSQKD